jgi:hypothetical protein
MLVPCINIDLYFTEIQCKLILALTIMTLTVMTTVGLVQISSVFAAPQQGGNPHNQLSPCSIPTHHTPSTGNPHICETMQSGGSESSGAGKVVLNNANRCHHLTILYYLLLL